MSDIKNVGTGNVQTRTKSEQKLSSNIIKSNNVKISRNSVQMHCMYKTLAGMSVPDLRGYRGFSGVRVNPPSEQ